MGRDDPRARMLAGAKLGAIKGGISREIERQDGLAYARRYRAAQPFKAMLDSLYGAD